MSMPSSPQPDGRGAPRERERERERAFIASLMRLARDWRQRPALAALRRGLDLPLGEAVEMFPYVVPWLGAGLSPERQEDYFLVASLFALYHLQRLPASQSHESGGPGETGEAAGLSGSSGLSGLSGQVAMPELSGGFRDAQGVTNFGISLRRLLIPGVLPAGGDRVERYMVALLETSREGLPHQLRFLVSLMRSYAIPVDWALLLADLADWSCDDRRIQRAWAQAYWRYSLSAPPEGVRGA